MNLIPLSERVGTAILNTLRAKYKVTFDEILQTIFETFPDSLTPDSDSVKAILEEYAEKAPGGYWKLKPLETKEEETKMHTQKTSNIAAKAKLKQAKAAHKAAKGPGVVSKAASAVGGAAKKVIGAGPKKPVKVKSVPGKGIVAAEYEPESLIAQAMDELSKK